MLSPFGLDTDAGFLISFTQRFGISIYSQACVLREGGINIPAIKATFKLCVGKEVQSKNALNNHC